MFTESAQSYFKLRGSHVQENSNDFYFTTSIYFDGIIRFKVDDENKFEPLCQLLNSNNIQLQKVVVNNAINILNLANEKIYKNEVSYQESVIFFDMTKKLKDIFMCVCPPKSPLTITKGNSISKTI